MKIALIAMLCVIWLTGIATAVYLNWPRRAASPAPK